MASSLADYAPTQAEARRGPSPLVAALLTVLTPGLGHLYIGQARRGITLFILVMIADTLLMFAMMGVLARFWMFATCLLLLLALWLFILIDATTRAYRMQDFPDHGYNRWPVYAGAFVLACLVFAAPCLYAVHARASGNLLWMNAVTASMEPTLREGEYFLADATYYRNRAPSRGEVAVYVHPKSPDLHYIKRIVAVEGDRVAIKNGRTIVNGMAIEEPYIEAPPPPPLPRRAMLADVKNTQGAAGADMPEVRVPPGYVFVLGDNRAISVDSRDTVAHGPVPVKNLIGRVTDIAFSRHLPRLGRWIGTPSI
jgi:signal peptidase I